MLYGPVSWGIHLSAIRSIEVQTYFMMREQLIVRFLGSDIATFNVPVSFHGAKMRRLILSHQRLATPPPTPKFGANEEGGGEAGMDGMLVGVVQAYRGMPIIPFGEFYAVTQDQEKVSKAAVRRHLVQLLANGRVAGQLTTKGFRREVVGTVQCQVCDQGEVDPVVYWQCPKCYRKVCTSCRGKQAKCPVHPEIPTLLVKMPTHCPHCHAVVGELRAVTDLLCQQCGTPLHFG